MKKSFILSFICMGLLSYGQVGIGTETPRGALDINQPTTNDAGLVLPTNSNVANLVNPQTNGTPVPGTIMYDSTQDCVRLYKENNTWSNCIGERNNSSVGGTGVIFALPGSTGDGTTQGFVSQLANRTNFGPTGAYNSAVTWINIHSGQSSVGGNAIEDMENGAEIYSKYNIINIEGFTNNSPFRIFNAPGTIERANILADKLKDYVNRGGVLYISLNQPANAVGRRHLIQTLFREFMGFDFTYANRGLSNMVYIRTTNHQVNNGPFGDARDRQFYPNFTAPNTAAIAANHSRINIGDLPATSEAYLVHTYNSPNPQEHEALVFSGGPGNRVIFYTSYELGLTLPTVNGTSAQDVVKRNFILNQVVNLIEKTN